MKLLPSARDRVRIQVTSADVWGSIRLVNGHCVSLYQVRQEDDLTVSFQIHRKDYQWLKSFLEKRGDRVVLVQKTMLHAVQQSILSRPLLYSGLLLFFAVSLLLPTRILTIQVEGNHAVPTRRILEAAEAAGITFFSPCVQVRSEQMKNALLSAVPELQWAGVNTYGSRAVISVRERADGAQTVKDEKLVSSIVAQRDGIIQSVTALRGTIQCREGQAVTAGQVLISGYTDCGICIRAERAAGEVYAQTLRTLRAVTPDTEQLRLQPQRQQRRFSIILGKNRINLWKDSGIWDGSCDRISREYVLTLPGGFPLPVSFVCETLHWYSSAQKEVEEASARNRLTSFSQNYLLNQMIAGIITHTDQAVEKHSGVYLLTGQYLCSEMIGREHLENGAPHE